MIVKVGRSAGKHYLRRDVGMRSKSYKVFDEREVILALRFWTEQNELRMVEVSPE